MRDSARLIAAGLALVPEDRAQQGIALSLLARENLTLPHARQRGRLMLRSDWQAREFAQATAILGIVPARRPLPCSAFSGGNQQKILLVKWLLNDPRVLLPHEPTEAVDIGAPIDILRTIRAAADRGVCVLFASIELEDVAAVCDRVAVMRRGAVMTQLASDPSPRAITTATCSPSELLIGPGAFDDHPVSADQ